MLRQFGGASDLGLRTDCCHERKPVPATTVVAAYSMQPRSASAAPGVGVYLLCYGQAFAGEGGFVDLEVGDLDQAARRRVSPRRAAPR